MLSEAERPDNVSRFTSADFDATLFPRSTEYVPSELQTLLRGLPAKIAFAGPLEARTAEIHGTMALHLAQFMGRYLEMGPEPANRMNLFLNSATAVILARDSDPLGVYEWMGSFLQHFADCAGLVEFYNSGRWDGNKNNCGSLAFIYGLAPYLGEEALQLSGAELPRTRGSYYRDIAQRYLWAGNEPVGHLPNGARNANPRYFGSLIAQPHSPQDTVNYTHGLNVSNGLLAGLVGGLQIPKVSYELPVTMLDLRMSNVRYLIDRVETMLPGYSNAMLLFQQRAAQQNAKVGQLDEESFQTHEHFYCAGFGDALNQWLINNQSALVRLHGAASEYARART
ncbi:MAG: hypothetical protein WCJ70_03290 [bacterium]